MKAKQTQLPKSHIYTIYEYKWAAETKDFAFFFPLAIGYINYKHKLYTDTHDHIFLKDTERMGSGDILNKIASYYNSKINSFRRCKHSHSFVGLKVFLFCIVFFARVYKCTNKAVCCYAT